MVQGPNFSNIKHNQSPLDMNTIYQQQFQQKQHQVVKGPNVSNIQHNHNPLDMHAIYQQ